MNRRRGWILMAAGLLALAGFSPDEPGAEPVDQAGAEPANQPPQEAQEIVLGPVDGHDLPITDLDRVSAGDMAPDFTAMTLGGEPLTLSDYRGDQNVILVFYRGHW